MIKKIYIGLIMITIIFSSALSAQDCLTLYAEHQAVSSGETVCLDIKVKDFTNIISFQHSLEFDTEQLSYLSTSNAIFAGMYFGTPESITTSDSHITLNWLEQNLMPTNLADGSTLFTVCFDVIGEAESSSQINIGDGFIINEFLSSNDENLATGFIDPTVFITTTGNLGSALVIDEICATSSNCVGEASSITVTPQGGVTPYTYLWSGPNGFASTTNDISALEPGDYFLEVTDVNMSSVYTNITITSSTIEEITSIVINPTCTNQTAGSIQLSSSNGALSGYDLVWSTGETSAAITGLSVGDYTVTVSSNIGNCEEVLSFTLAETAQINTLGTCVQENGDVIATVDIEVVCGLTPPLTFAWSDGSTSTSNDNTGSLTITNPSPLLFYGAVITDINGMTANSTSVFFLGCSGTFTIEAGIVNASCSASIGSIYLEVSPAGDYYEYAWSNGSTATAITDLEPGLYGVTVTNTQNGEVISSEYEVTNEGSMVASLSYECQSDSDDVVLTAVAWTGAAPYTFEWSNGETNTTDEIYNSITVPDGTYYVTITDQIGCSTSMDIPTSCSQVPVNIYVSPTGQLLSPGEEICFDYNVSNFIDVSSMQFTITWDAYLLDFNDITDFGLPGISLSSFGIFDGLGYATFAWFHPQATSSTLDDNSTIFSVCFTAQNSGQGAIGISSAPTPLELSNFSNDIMPTIINEATYSVGTEGGSPTLSTSTATAQQGEDVCIDIYGQDLLDIVSMQFSLNWDPTALAFTSVDFSESVLAQINTSNFGNSNSTDVGTLPFAWIDNTLNGQTFGNDQLLFSACFTTLAPSGFAPVAVSNSPIIIEFTNTAGGTLTPQIASGGVNITSGLVWPGDTDDNGVVNHFDLLNIGLGYHQTGAIRDNSTESWIGQAVADWSEETPQSNINYKFSDTDGNGQIEAIDKNIILSNWEETNELWGGNMNDFNDTPIYYTTSSTPLYVEARDVEEGEEVSLDIVLGGDNPAENVYGLAFTIVYDPSIIVSGSLSLDFDNSWLGTEHEDFITLYKNNPYNGRISVAVTRIDGSPITGSGAIGNLNITIEDVIFRDDYIMYFDIQNIRMINENEEGLLAVGQSTTGTVRSTVGSEFQNWDVDITIFPNPISDELHIESKDIKISNIDILSIDGKQLHQQVYESSISVQSFAPGIYYLRLHTDKGITYKKVIKL